MDAESQLCETSELLSIVSQFELESGLTEVCHKLARRIRADAVFLENSSKSESGGMHLASSNLPYLRGVLDVAKQSNNVVDVMRDIKRFGIVCDVVCDGGRTWKKVIARNPQSMHLVWAGRGQYGNKDIVRKAQCYYDAARKSCDYSPPAVVFTFCSGVTYEMAQALEAIGICVEGERKNVSKETLDRLRSVVSIDCGTISDDEDLFEIARRNGCEQQSHLLAPLDRDSDDYFEVLDNQDSVPNNSLMEQHLSSPRKLLDCDLQKEDSHKGDAQTPEDQHTGAAHTEESLSDIIKRMPIKDKVFLDITTLIAYVSDVSNGGCHVNFSDKVLNEQGAQECKRPVLDAIIPFMKGRTLVSCSSAVRSFQNILETLGGDGEKLRAEKLLSDIKVIPDNISDRCMKLHESSQIKPRSKVIFGTADRVECEILTSNVGFVRAAIGQGCYISAIIHDSRALTENKRLGID